MELNTMEEQPPIKQIQDFEDSVDYCFYLLGYTEGIRGITTVVPEDSHKEAYSQGVQDGEEQIRWLFFDAATNEN
jgi:hypothetical protein